jgi:hypothetical protein
MKKREIPRETYRERKDRCIQRAGEGIVFRCEFIL